MEKTLKIEGMSCSHCTGTVEKALKAIPGVSAVTVDLAAKTATITAADGVSDDTLASAVNETGFEVTAVE